MVGGPRDRVGSLAIEGDVLTHPVWVGQPPIDRLQQCNFSFNMFAQKNANDIKSLDKRSIKLLASLASEIHWKFVGPNLSSIC